MSGATRGESLRGIPTPSGRFKRKPRPWRPNNTFEAIRQLIRHEVLSAEMSRAIVRKSGALSGMADYFQHRNSMGADPR